MKKVPDFFVVGAQKAGTTSLHDWLVQQPDICLPTIKETGFFACDENYSWGIDWYLKQFPNCAESSAMGEINPEYMFFEAAAPRIRQYCRSPKIIFLLRNPIDRAYSQYQMTVRRGYEKLPFNEALVAEKDRLVGKDFFKMTHFSYMARSRYCDQINRMRDTFPDSDYLYIKFNDLISGERGAKTYEEICRFIGLKSSPAIADRGKKSNQASMPRLNYVNRLVYDKKRPLLGSVIKFVARPISGMTKKKIRGVVDRLNQKAVNNKDLDKKNLKVPSFAIDAAFNEIEELGATIGLQCGEWREGIERWRS